MLIRRSGGCTIRRSEEPWTMSDQGNRSGETGAPMRSRIPSFDTIEEEAAFWDTHSSADFDDELEVVDDVMFVPAGSERVIAVRLEADSLASLAEQARRQGVSPAQLARTWILERLRHAS